MYNTEQYTDIQLKNWIAQRITVKSTQDVS